MKKLAGGPSVYESSWLLSEDTVELRPKKPRHNLGLQSGA